MRDYDYDDGDDIDLKHITHLYELRHACNVLGVNFVAKTLGISIQRIGRLCQSDIHGSKVVMDFIRGSDRDFEEGIEELEEEEEDRFNGIQEARRKNESLVCDLKRQRKEFAGIGTNKAKRRLNKLSLTSPLAKAIRLSMEIEDKNICAKDSYGGYKDKIYRQKAALIMELCELCRKEGWKYGVQKSDVPLTSHVVYFEIPTCEQLSWHLSEEKMASGLPTYDGQWDKKQGSTLVKLEAAARLLLPTASVANSSNL